MHPLTIYLTVKILNTFASWAFVFLNMAIFFIFRFTSSAIFPVEYASVGSFITLLIAGAMLLFSKYEALDSQLSNRDSKSLFFKAEVRYCQVIVIVALVGFFLSIINS